MGKNSEYRKMLHEVGSKKLGELQSELPDYVSPYLNQKKISLQLNTVISYAYDLTTFFQYLKDTNPLLKDKTIRNIPISFLENLTYLDIDDFQSYLAWHSGDDKTNTHLNHEKGIARRMAALRGFFDFMTLHRYMSNDPTVGAAKTHKPVHGEIKTLTSDEVKRILDAVSNPYFEKQNRRQIFCQKTQLRDVAIITLLLNTGIRVSECVGLDITDINFENKQITIIRKGGNSDRIDFNNIVLEALKEYIQLERPDFIIDDNEKALFLSLRKKRLCVRSLQAMIQKFGNMAVTDKSVSPHYFRRTYGSALYEKTGDIKLVADVLGHKSIDTTNTAYATTSSRRKKEAASYDLFS